MRRPILVPPSPPSHPQLYPYVLEEDLHDFSFLQVIFVAYLSWSLCTDTNLP